MSRRIAVALALLALTFGLVAGVAAPSQALPTPSVTITATPATVYAGGTTKLSGRVTRVKQGTVVTLQKKVGTRFVKFRTAKVAYRGAWAVRFSPTTGATRYRLYVPRTARTAATYSRVVTVTTLVRTTLTAKPSEDFVFDGATVTISGSLKPALPGTSVWLQKWTGSKWVSLRSTTVRSNGSYSVIDQQHPAQGENLLVGYRTYRPRTGNYAAAASAPFDVGYVHRFASVALGSRTYCTVQADGTGWCWGDNDEGQLGTGDTASYSNDLVKVPGSWRAITPGTGDTVCGVQTDNTGWCWGNNSDGQVGDGTVQDRSTPTQLPGEWIELSSADTTTCGKRQDGTAWCWGNNTYGQIGDGTYQQRTSPAQVPGYWAIVQTVDERTCGIQENSTAWCWGKNDQGQVGDGSNQTRNTPQQLAGSNWTGLSLGEETTCGLQTGNTAWCWGDNGVGTVGDGTTQDRYAPVQLPGSWSSINTGMSSGTTCGIQTDGTGWCWGWNDDGQVGGGPSIGYTQKTPLQLPGTWSKLVTSGWTSCGIQTNGTGWCWGYNAYSQASGDGYTSNVYSPQQLEANGVEAWIDITTHDFSSCGRTADGNMWCWGASAL